MKKKKGSKKIITIVMILLLLLVVWVCLSIAKSGRDEKPSPGPNGKWSVRIDDKSYQEAPGSLKAVGYNVSGTKMNYVVPLRQKGDFYQATLTIVNDGDYDAKLDAVVIGGLTDEQKKVIKHTVSFGEYAFINNANNVSLYLDAGKSETIEISILVNDEITTDKDYTFEFTLNFVKD